ncbi:MAG: diguanylate cyclase [Nitrospirae bacterium]|nr:MAG: diguanylate cyclase [Nitrospirota bacterium]
MLNEDHLYRHLLDEMHDGIYIVDKQKKITYWNKSAERLTGYKASETIGAHCTGDILMHCDKGGATLCKRSCPVVESVTSGKRFEGEVYLQHKEGHRVPVLMCVSPITDPEGNITGAVEIFSDHSWSVAAVNRIEELRKIALLDSLTEVANRRFIEISIANLLSGMKRYNFPFGLLFIDVDHFKKINDTHGHETGDRVLKMIAKSLSSTLRPLDIIGRWGGEEFVVLLLHATHENLTSVATRLRLLVENSFLNTESGIIRTTVSIGGTVANVNDTIETTIKRADELMYQSKQKGRNCVTI